MTEEFHVLFARAQMNAAERDAAIAERDTAIEQRRVALELLRDLVATIDPRAMLSHRDQLTLWRAMALVEEMT